MMARYLALFILTLLICTPSMEAKKIKSSFTLEKEKKSKAKDEIQLDGIPVVMADSLKTREPAVLSVIHSLNKCKFVGYDKEPNANKESFILVNDSENFISGFEVKIDYLDMEGRMLHSREIRQSCQIPPGESRRFDIKTWDTQHTYYYYLGNEPKKVATPFQVAFSPLSFWIEK